MIKLVLFFNNSTNGNPNAPYFTGKLTLEDGTELKTVLWTNVSAAGQTYYSGHAKPIEPKPTDPQPTEPGSNEPATKEFIADVIKDWEDKIKEDFPDLGRRRLEPGRDIEATNAFLKRLKYKIKEDFPDLGRRRLEPGRDIEATNAFLKRLKYNESKAFLNTYQNTHIDDITDDMAEEYYKAKTFIIQYESERG